MYRNGIDHLFFVYETEIYENFQNLGVTKLVKFVNLIETYGTGT